MALETAGLLCALIFVISSILEVVSINNLYVSQHGLLGLLLVVLALWALLEVTLVSRREPNPPLRSLRLLLGVQIGLLAVRHWSHVSLQQRGHSPLATPLTIPEFREAVVFLPLYLLLYLAISRCLIQAFSAGARRRSRQLQELQEKQRAQLEQKLKTSLTAAAVVHEIQQPLSRILLNCRSASHWLDALPAESLPKSLQAGLLQLCGDGERVVATMERMRMLLRNVETEHKPIDLTASVDSGLLYLKNDLADAGVQTLLEGLDQPCHLNGDGAQLQIAVVNLIRNALQAMHQQQPGSRRLLLRLQQHADRVELCIADSGPGFPEAYSCDTSWELLKSTKASGMGIGLFIAQTAATNHHGQLSIARSSELGGAEVVIELPIITTIHE